MCSALLYSRRAGGGRAGRRHGDGGQLFFTRGEGQAKAHRRHRDLCRRHGVGVPCHLRGCAARCWRPSSRASTPRVPEPERPSPQQAAPRQRCAASFSPPYPAHAGGHPSPRRLPECRCSVCRPPATARVHESVRAWTGPPRAMSRPLVLGRIGRRSSARSALARHR
jgi:hypothetical protein